MTSRAARACVIGAMLLLSIGCEGRSEEQAASAAAPKTTWEFDSPEALIAHLQSLGRGRDLIELYEHMYFRTDEERWALEKNRDIAKARLDFLKITNVVYGEEDAPVVDVDQHTKEFAASLSKTTVEPHGDSRVLVHYTNAEGESAALVFAKIRDHWMVHATSLANGEEIDLMWCAARQNQYAQALQAYQDAILGLRKGAYQTAEEAQRDLDAMLSRPAPGPPLNAQ